MNTVARVAWCCFVVAPLLAGQTATAQRSAPLRVVHPSASSSDQFGTSIAAYEDTMIVGAPFDDVGANANQGSAHIFRWTGTGWTLEASITAADGAANDAFGWSVAIGRDTVVVGAYGDDIGATVDQGSAYVFVRTPGGTTWTQQAKLTASDGVATDSFGWSVAISGETAVVGRYLGEGGNTDPGAAYVFVRSAAGVWTQQARLIASDRLNGDAFGASVSISGDTVVVGATGDDLGAGIYQGSAYVFVRPAGGTTWTQQAKLVASDGAAFDNFGVCASLSGDLVVIGSYADDVGANVNQGSVYVFVRTTPGGSTWAQQQKLVAPDATASAFFGISVSLSGTTVVVGAYGAATGGINAGAAYVFSKSNPGFPWFFQTRLDPSDGAGNDSFGYSVAFSGDFIAVGAATDDNGIVNDQGSAWVFSRVGSNWIGPEFHAFASDGAANDNFGVSVAISGNTAVVGASADDVGANANQGSAYVFVRQSVGAAWTQQAKLTASDGAANDFFGSSVAIWGDTIVVGANLDDVGANVNQGSAYVFTRSGTAWSQQQKLTASDGAANDNFGVSVGIYFDTVVVGANNDDVGANADQGSAYVFTRSGTIWTQGPKLTASDGAASDLFGSSVAISPDTIVVGAYGDDNGAVIDQGSAYVFQGVVANWTQRAKLTASDGAAGDNFGVSVAVSNQSVIIGASNDDIGSSTDQGSAYVFVLDGATWSQQAKLTSPDCTTLDRFGISVAIAGDTAVVGAFSDDIGIFTDQGSAFVFTRPAGGTTWTQQPRLTAPDGAGNDIFGYAVALADSTILVGAAADTVGAVTQQGSAYTFEFLWNDLPLAANDSTGAASLSLGDALLTAQSGQQVTATEGAFRTISTLDTLGRSLALRSTGDVRTPPGSSLTLGGSSTLTAATGSSVELFGSIQTSSPGSPSISGAAFSLGLRGRLTARAGTSLAINAPSALLEGPVQLEQGAALTLAGSVSAYAPLTAFSGASITAGGTFTNSDTLAFTAGTMSMPLFSNLDTVNVFGASAVFGSYTNQAGAVTTIRGGTLFVFGSLTNNGTIVGTICSNCLGTPPNLEVGGSLALGSAADLAMPYLGSLVHAGGSFDCAIDSNARFDLSLATLRFEDAGGTGEQLMEVMSRDIGAAAAGLDRTIPGHYPINVLEIGPSPSVVRLVDSRDNDGLGQAGAEAVYVDTLRIDAGSRLANADGRVYYKTLVNNGTVDVPLNLILLPPPCPADFNGDGQVTAADVGLFVSTWFASLQTGAPGGDFDGDGNITAADVGAFVSAWFAAVNGGC